MTHTPKPPRREDPLQDARLRARLTAQTPKTRDLWPAVAARLQEPPPRRPVRRAALLLAAAVALAALLMGAAALRGFRIYDTATGESLELDPGEPYLPQDGSSTGFSMTRLSDTDPNWREQVHDDRDEWPETWDKQTYDYDENGEVVSGGTRQLDFVNQARFGQAWGEITDLGQGAAGSLCLATLPANEQTALLEMLDRTGTSLWLPEDLPERYVFAHGQLAPYVTPRQMRQVRRPTAENGTDDGRDWAAAIWDLPEEVRDQIDQVELVFYGPDGQRVLFDSTLSEEAGHLITGSSDMTLEELALDGFEQALLTVDTNGYYEAKEVRLDLYEPIDPIRVQSADALWPQLAETLPDSPMMRHTRDWTDTRVKTMRYRYYSLSLIGFGDGELDALLRSLRAYGAGQAAR